MLRYFEKDRPIQLSFFTGVTGVEILFLTLKSVDPPLSLVHALYSYLYKGRQEENPVTYFSCCAPEQTGDKM